MASHSFGTWRKSRNVLDDASYPPQDQARKVYAGHSDHYGDPGGGNRRAFILWSAVIVQNAPKSLFL